MPNRLFYTAKFDSDYIIYCKSDVKANFFELFRSGNIISLADSQVLKTIRQLTNHKVDLNKIEEWYNERDRIKNRANSKENKERIRELQKNIYDMMYIPEYITVVINSDKHYDKFFNHGFIFNGNKYTRFSCSASQARVNTVVFIKDELKNQMKEILDNGRKKDKSIAPSKYNAYFGLYSSAIKEVTTPRFCIIPDFWETDKVIVDYIITTDDYSDDIVEEREIEVEFNRFDGGGLITPQMAEQWSKDIGIYFPDEENEEDRGYIACQFCLRQSFAKGMVNVFEILDFCEEKNDGNYIIKDIYGNDVDLRNIDVILTEGQVKLYDSFGYYDNDKFIPSQEVYEKNIENNKIVWGVTRYTPEEDDKTLITNYQFLQTLKMNDEDIKELCETTVKYITGVTNQDYNYALLFMLGEGMTERKIKNYMKSSDNYWLKSLICNPNLFNDKYTKEKIRDCIKRRIEQACIGKIMVEGNFQVIIPDSYALMEWVCYRDRNRVKGLLQAGECYSKFWKDRNNSQILSQRSPLTHFSECHLLNVTWNEEIDKWFKYSYTGFYINTHDDSTMRWAGADFDYDIVASTNNPVMIRSVYKNQKPVTYDIPKPFKKVFTEEDLYIADKKTFGSLIGPLTNRGTSIVALIAKYEKRVEKFGLEEDKKKLQLLHNRLKMVCAGQSRQIDKAKIGEKVKGIPKIWTTYQHIDIDDDEEIVKQKEFYNSILCDKKPYFFKYVYKTENKKYNQYYKKVDLRCYSLYNMTLRELLSKEDRTLEQEEFIKNFKDKNGFINTECEMNRICWYIEDVFKDINNKVKDNSKFNYNYFITPNINFNETTYKKISEFLIQFLSKKRNDVGQKNKQLFSEEKLSNNSIIDDDKNSWTQTLKNELYQKYCSNGYELTNYLIKFFYEDKKNFTKSTLWKICGDILYNICLQKSNGEINIPIRDKFGDIEFWFDRFSQKHILLNEGSDNND